jgi:hypothetical protein
VALPAVLVAGLAQLPCPGSHSPSQLVWVPALLLDPALPNPSAVSTQPPALLLWSRRGLWYKCRHGWMSLVALPSLVCCVSRGVGVVFLACPPGTSAGRPHKAKAAQKPMGPCGFMGAAHTNGETEAWSGVRCARGQSELGTVLTSGVACVGGQWGG